MIVSNYGSIVEETKISNENHRNIVKKILWSDLKTLYESKRNSRRNGFIFTFLGAVIPLIVITVYFVFSFFSLLYLLGALFISLLIAGSLVKYGLSLILYDSERVFSPAGGKYTVFNEVKCNDCDYKETRPYKMGNYVGKELDEECPKCHSSLKVSGIFAKPEREIETVGMPILLQGQGGTSINLFDRILLAFNKIFPISTLAMKLFRKSQKDRE